ncbi:IclR family transcriptional regulator [Pseudomonas sp. OIL-1]|uniref:IclR family transcriptional regulator n=1 Tax=Pseudomonas sp. OIL-1 TaxID=2706126 RepID=UPI0013A7B5CA|nr:IclR family transcriptional regulator [Pseudomonas sp. OIL-1]
MSEADNTIRSISADNHLLDPMSTAEDEVKDRHLVTALARGVEILRCFNPRETLLGNQDLVNKTGLPKATVTRLTHTLTRLGCLKRQAQTGKYQLDVGVMGFGYALLSNLSVRATAHPLMEEMAAYSEASVAMAARDRLQMVYLDVAYGKANMSTRRHIGTYLPICLTSVGRATLAAMPEAERDYMMDHLRGTMGEQWPSTRRSLERSFRDYADFGYCLSIGEWHRDINAVAVPMLHAEHGLLAFNCGGPGFHLPQDKLEDDIGPRLVNMVSNIGSATR